MSTLSCSDPISPCNCPTGVSCIQIPRQGDVCARNVCASSSGDSPSSLGGTIGGALGGVCGIIAALSLIYWFWWKPRGLAAARKRYSKQVTSRQSKIMDRKSQMGMEGGTATKRTSVHINMEGMEGSGATRRASPRESVDGDLPTSIHGTTGGTPRASMDSENPFSDHARSSMATFADASSTRTSDFSFRSSHSTNIIPIAYIPPHSNSLSLDDATRGPYGESLSDPHRDSRRTSKLRNSIPLSIDSRDSVVPSQGCTLSGTERDRERESPLLTISPPEHPSILHSAGGAPIRPPRSPGLDLKLPTPMTSPLASAHFPDNRHSMRPSSGFPWEPPAAGGSGEGRPNLESKFSSSTTTGMKGNGGEGQGMSAHLEAGSYSSKAGSHMSTMSVMTTSSSRSGQSTMSYILDPPQIITPVNTQGLRRVEVLGRGQAGLVRLGGSGQAWNPTSPLANAVTPTSPTESSTHSSENHEELGGTFLDRPKDPFADSAAVTPLSGRFSAVGAQGDISNSSVEIINTETGSRTRPVTNESLWAPSNRNTTSTMAAANESSDIDPRLSYASSVGSSSMLDGIPFLDGPGNNLSGARSSQRISVPTSSAHHSASFPLPSPLFPKPLDQLHHPGNQTINVQPATPLPDASFSTLDSSMASSSSVDHSGSTSLLSPSNSSGYPLSPNTTYNFDPLQSPPKSGEGSTEHSLLSASVRAEQLSSFPLPAPFLPFAGQRPSSTTSNFTVASSHSKSNSKSNRVQSQAMSIRSGYGSGLSQIPFQLGFQGGIEFGGSERGSVMSGVSGHRGSGTYGNGEEEEEEEREFSGPLGIEGEGKRADQGEEEENPFGKKAEVQARVEEMDGADPRASINTLELSAMLSAQLGEGLE